jgi:NAD(P)-dependent dehydrogenase (short-subunit alcohol dehydrogenase family)
MSTYDFSGKVAVVTGAGRGIGRAYAEALAGAGAAVVVADIDEDNAGAVADSISAAGGTATATAVDVSSPDSARDMAAVAVERFGGIDFLVNNAAIFGGMKLDFLLTVDWEYLERFLAVNLTGAPVPATPRWRTVAAAPSSTSRPPPPISTPVTTAGPRPV